MTGGGGVNLRISGDRRPVQSLPEGEWQPLSFDFAVEEDVAEVQLVCEFVGAAGEVEFDLAAFKLVRQ
jgi:hypothetical protein